ncbi:UNVERIFIED_CONTAM: hypothetical protein O8I53_08655 [Campylobacter lari]
MDYTSELIKTVDTKKVNQLTKYAKNKALNYIMLFSGTLMILGILASVIAFIIIGIKNTRPFGVLEYTFIGLDIFFFIFYMVFFAHILQLLSLSFIFERAIKNEVNP